MSEITARAWCEQNYELLRWTDKRLRERIYRLTDWRPPFGYTLGYCYEILDRAAQHYSPNIKSVRTGKLVKFSSYYTYLAFKHFYDLFLRQESESWYRAYDRNTNTPTDVHQTNINFAYHEYAYYMWRIPEHDLEWCSEVLHRFHGPAAAWDYFTKFLKTRELQVITRRLQFRHSLDDIGLDMKISRERVRQIEQAGIKRIRRNLIANGFLESLPDNMPVLDMAAPTGGFKTGAKTTCVRLRQPPGLNYGQNQDQEIPQIQPGDRREGLTGLAPTG